MPSGIFIPVSGDRYRVADDAAGPRMIPISAMATHGTEASGEIPVKITPTYLINGRELAMFDTTQENSVSGALVKIGSVEDLTRPDGSYSIRMLSTGKYAVTITHPNFYPREKSVNVNGDMLSPDEKLVPASFDMAFFDTLTSRLHGGGTTRMMKTPRIYIIDGALQGYTGYETPTQQEIEEVIATWQNDIRQLSNGFIQVPDSFIYIGHDINDPIFKMAVDKIYNGGATPSLADTNKVWNLVNWNKSLPGNGDHSEWVDEKGVIVGARQRYRPGMGKDLSDIESAQSIGFHVDPKDAYSRYDYVNRVYTPKFRQAGEYLYSRPPNTKSPDKSN